VQMCEFADVQMILWWRADVRSHPEMSRFK